MRPNRRIIKTIGAIMLLSVSSIEIAQSQESAVDSLNIYEMNLDELLNVKVVTVSKSEETQSDAPGVISVLTKDEIARFGGTTLSSLLERIPGLVGTSAYMSDRSILSSRGDQITSTSSHVLLLINGRPVREVLEGGISSEIYETFPVNIIERIEVIKGPGSVLYGSNAFSGVINVITEKAEKTGVSITGLGGTGSAFGTSGDIKVKAGDLSIVAAGRYLKKPDWNVDYSRQTGATAFNRQVSIPNKGPGAYLGATYKNLSFMSSYNQWDNMGFASKGTGNVYWKKLFNNLGYDFEITKIWHSSVNVNYTQSQFDADSFPKIHRKSYEFLSEWTNFIKLSDKSKLIVGALYIGTKGKEYNLLSGSEVVSSDAKRSAYGAYAQADYSLFKTVKAIGGVQVNKIENISLGVVPRAGLIWSPLEKLNIKALYGQAFRAPSINEVSLNAPTLKGNSALKPEMVSTVDFAVSYLAEQMQFGANYFYSSMSDIIIQSRTVQPAMYQNLGRAMLQGFELDGKIYVNKNLFISASMLYQSIKDTSGNKNITPIANFSAKGGISYKLDKGVTFSLFDIYQGAIDDKYKSSRNTSPEKAFNKIDLHCNVDMNKVLNLQIKPTFNVFAHADNLLNSTVWLPLWGSTPGNAMPYNQGRWVYAGLTVNF